MSNHNPLLTTTFLMVRVARAHRSLVSNALAEMGLHIGQERLLMELWQEDGLTQTELACRLCIEPPTLTKMLSRLEKTKLLEKRRDVEDGRICRIFLTDKGHSFQKPVTDLWLELEETILANLSVEERLLYRRFLMQICDNLESAKQSQGLAKKFTDT
ncbi:MarR family winged helix-turn-helix transcriptional regulator [Pleurocapsa sp. PCC 7319]|uniref:MarR family winged helix-turn-helix transcriptional regulator n=1 Tax=Pleurocapsa sp. PCC 7319 TaxID=118161 RepID=UPI00037AC3D1|nr:MarR family transcriptional regulator [Pleurocapsa sp. PCC 7319]